MQENKVNQQLLQQELALDNYLATLLDEIPSTEELDQLESLKLVEPEAVKKTVKEEGLDPRTTKEKVESVNALTAVPEADKPLSVMPEWAQGEFQALFFRVDKLTLATPLTELLRLIKLDKSPTQIPGQPSWFLGLLDSHEQRIGVLDTGQLILGKSRGQQRDLEKHPFKSLLITHDGKWGIACDEVLAISTLEPDKVRWRTMRQKKPWLLGTVIEELVTVVDVNCLVPHSKSA